MSDDEHNISQSPNDSLVENEYPSPKTDIRKVKNVPLPEQDSLVFSGISYNISMKEKRKKVHKTILRNCSGRMIPGLNAVLGPTGSGKTSLLNILAGRRERKKYSGDVIVNGNYQRSDFCLASGFVVQDDIVMGTLTVRENLSFSAALRLCSKKYSNHDREQRVEMVIQDLGLYKCADTKVGTNEKRGVSGGEKRRTSIGMELIISPNFLFLDEPTTGLDASTACTVMEVLKRQSEKGKTIVFSIHQPRYTVFKQFDTITLLSLGEMVYHGSANDILSYFSDIGYGCEMYNNPADHFLDVIIRDEKFQRDIFASRALDQGESTRPWDRKTLALLYEESDQCKHVQQIIQPVIHEAAIMQKNAVEIAKYTYQSGFFRQLAFLSKRTVTNLLRDPRLIVTQFFINIFMGLVIGGIYFHVKLDTSGYTNRSGVFFLLTVNMVFSNLSAVALFLTEKVLFRNESANGYYRCSSYFISKLLCDIIPLRLIPILAFCSISYFMIGFQPSVEKFFLFLLTMVSTCLAGACICIFVSSSVDSIALANPLCTLPFIFMMIFSGFLNELTSIPKELQWLNYLSILKYGYRNLMINEIHGLTFTKCAIPGHINNTCSGDDYLRYFKINRDEFWYNEMALCVFMVFFFTLSYIQLLRMKKY